MIQSTENSYAPVTFSTRARLRTFCQLKYAIWVFVIPCVSFPKHNGKFQRGPDGATYTSRLPTSAMALRQSMATPWRQRTIRPLTPSTSQAVARSWLGRSYTSRAIFPTYR